MEWFDACIERLISGDSLNVVGLSGSGRSASLNQLEARLDAEDWVSTLWKIDDLRRMTRKQIKSAVEALTDPLRIPVLLIDDFGEYLMDQDGRWLERMLFSRINEIHHDTRASLRCVVVTHPRDREIVGPGSGLRERSHEISPASHWISSTMTDAFACSGFDELLALTGGNAHLLGCGGSGPAEKRGSLGPVAQHWLPYWVGQLDSVHQRRLATVLQRRPPARWRGDDADPVLAPLVVRSGAECEPTCVIPACIRPEELKPLLIGEVWPSRRPEVAARRLVARCGTDPRPLWADNFLSDVEKLDFALLVKLLHRVLDLLPSTTKFRLLSRDWIDGRRIYPQDICDALSVARLRPEIAARIEWRIYDQRETSNLHRRELLLPIRGVAFTLPPAQILVGQADPGNEADSATPVTSGRATIDAWKVGRKVIGAGGVSGGGD